MKLEKDDKGYYWREGYATSQSFRTKKAALRAAAREAKKMEELGLEGLASAGILRWGY